jgi:hypothetical protein
MKQQQLYMKQHHEFAVLKFPKDMIKSGPDVAAAAHSGPPNLNPPDDLVSPMEVLNRGAAGPSFTIVAAPPPTSTGGAGGAGGAGDTESVETDSDPATTPPSTAAGVPAINAPNPDGSVTVAPATTTSTPADPPPAATTTSTPATVSDSAAPGASPASAGAAPAGAAAAADSTPAQTTSTPAAPVTGATSSSTTAAPAATDKSDPATESTSKKKKGLHKLIPF